MLDEKQINSYIEVVEIHRLALHINIQKVSRFWFLIDTPTLMEIKSRQDEIQQIKSILSLEGIFIQEQPIDKFKPLSVSFNTKRSYKSLFVILVVMLFFVSILCFVYYIKYLDDHDRIEYNIDILRNGNSINAILQSSADTYSLQWGSYGNTSGSISPWSDYQDTREMNKKRFLNLFKDVVDETEDMWLILTLSKDGSVDKYKFDIRIKNDGDIYCYSETTEIIVSNGHCINKVP